MPSSSLRLFERHLLRDTELLIEAHYQTYPGRGRPSSVLTRSGVFLLCAAWEFYVEEVLLEAHRFVISCVGAPLELPEHVRRRLAGAIKADKHELAALRLAGDGWRTYLDERAVIDAGNLNTPSADNISDLFLKYVGCDLVDFFAGRSNQLSAFISKRGDIAHRGAQAGHVSIGDLEADYDFVCRLAAELDNELVGLIQGQVDCRPWNRRAIA